MSYLERYIISFFFLLSLPFIVYDAIKYYDKEYDESFLEWLFVCLDYAWEELERGTCE